MILRLVQAASWTPEWAARCSLTWWPCSLLVGLGTQLLHLHRPLEVGTDSLWMSQAGLDSSLGVGSSSHEVSSSQKGLALHKLSPSPNVPNFPVRLLLFLLGTSLVVVLERAVLWQSMLVKQCFEGPQLWLEVLWLSAEFCPPQLRRSLFHLYWK